MKLKQVFGSVCVSGQRSVFIIVLVNLAISSGVAAQQPSNGVGANRQPKFTEESVKNCLICHFGESMQAVAASPHGNAQNPDTPYSRQGCESCHGPGSFHVSRAYGGKGSPKLIDFGTGSGSSPRQEQLSACMACHEKEASGAPVIGFKGSTHDVSSINCSSCHQMHTETQPIDIAEQQAEVCFSCHGKERTGHPRLGRRSIDFSRHLCSNCHDVHPKIKGSDDD